MSVSTQPSGSAAPSPPVDSPCLPYGQKSDRGRLKAALWLPAHNQGRKVPYYMIVLSHTTPHTNLHINKST